MEKELLKMDLTSGGTGPSPSSYRTEGKITITVEFEQYIDSREKAKGGKPATASMAVPRKPLAQPSLQNQDQTPAAEATLASSRLMDLESKSQETIGVLNCRVVAAYNLVNMDTGLFGDVSDPYVTLKLMSEPESAKKMTKVINNDLNPVWNGELFTFDVKSPTDWLMLEVWDSDYLSSDDFLGRMPIPLSDILNGPSNSYRIKDHLKDIRHGELEIMVWFSRK